jgi:glycosyltransferase involved in cell wall biosynthesis
MGRFMGAIREKMDLCSAAALSAAGACANTDPIDTPSGSQRLDCVERSTMTDRVSFSFVVPCFNEEDNVVPTVESVCQAMAMANQDAYEVMLVDDCSTDRTLEHMQALAQTDPRIRVLHNPVNLGFGGSYKRGMHAAKADYVMMLPGDDGFPPDSIAEIIRHAGEADIIIPIVTNSAVRTWSRTIISKSFNIWGDGGVITTDDDEFARRIGLLRNHGLVGRDVVVSLGGNSRLDTVQAVVALQVMEAADWISERRRKNAAFYDRALAGIHEIKLSPRNPRVVHSFVTYQILAERRDELLQHCVACGIECKIHYPIALYRQEGLRHLGYRPGDFPVTDRHASTALTLPVHQYLSSEQLAFVVATIEDFFRA